MPWTSKHIKWFAPTKEKLKTADGKDVEIWEFRHQTDAKVLTEWARHFRNHYCLDSEIDTLRGRKSRKDFLINLKFPCKSSRLGPGIRAGDFGEILVADYLQWLLSYFVPRLRWCSKMIRDESPKGSDVIGFKCIKKEGISGKDVLAVYEVKTKFSKGSGKSRLQDAINDSAKDHLRIDESLNYIKQKLLERKEIRHAKVIERFQTPVDLPYKETYGAAAIISEEFFQVDEIEKADTSKIPTSPKSIKFISHPNGDNLVLIVIKGSNMMALVHELYRRAADEA